MKSFARSFLIFLGFTSFLYAGPSWTGKVVGISDGDTITVMHNGKGEKIRLYGIDCPEKKQAFGQKAKHFVSDLIFNKTVDIDPTTTDRYGRTIGWVHYNGQNINLEILMAGLAWHYKKYSSDRSLVNAESYAKKNKFGLWKEPNPVPPWNYRRGGKKKAVAKQQKIKNALPLSFQPTAGKGGVVYSGNHKSKKFHRPGCRYYNCSKCTEKFKSRTDAIKAGYSPCGICKP